MLLIHGHFTQSNDKDEVEQSHDQANEFSFSLVMPPFLLRSVPLKVTSDLIRLLKFNICAHKIRVQVKTTEQI